VRCLCLFFLGEVKFIDVVSIDFDLAMADYHFVPPPNDDPILKFADQMRAFDGSYLLYLLLPPPSTSSSRDLPST
jgi:hypothetical protein